MLQIEIKPKEMFDEDRQVFVQIPGKTIQLEHSLLSISKWEAKWHKPFISKEEKTLEETIDYVKCMTLSPNISDEVYLGLTNENINEINAYIDNPMTATWFNEKNIKRGIGKKTDEVITSELIYYWMISLNIPVEFQKWHLNRLITLIKVCDIKNTPPKKMSKREILSRNRSLNEARRMAMGTSG